MTGFVGDTEEVDYKKWYCFDPKCPWYKTKMTIEDNLDHLIKVHHIQAPVGYEMPLKSSGANKKNKKNKSKRK